MLYLGSTKISPIIKVESVGIVREVDSNGVFQIPQTETHVVLPDNATSISAYALYHAYRESGIVSFNSNKVETISGNYAMNYAFYHSKSMTNLEFPELRIISSGSQVMGYFCNGNTALTTISFPKLKEINTGSAFYYAFSGCTGLTSVSFPSLDLIAVGSVFNYAFRGCTNLTTMYFPKLKTTSFGSYSSQFNNMLQSVSNCVVHFPSNLESKISGWNFGGTNNTKAFDLAATE